MRIIRDMPSQQAKYTKQISAKLPQHDVTHASVSVCAFVANLNSTCRMHTETDMTLIEGAPSFALPRHLFTKSLRHSSHFFLVKLSPWIPVQMLQWHMCLQWICWCINALAYKSKLLKSSCSLTFHNKDSWGGQALYISVNNADIFPSMVQLDVANHQIPWYTLEGNMFIEKIK